MSSHDIPAQVPADEGSIEPTPTGSDLETLMQYYHFSVWLLTITWYSWATSKRFTVNFHRYDVVPSPGGMSFMELWESERGAFVVDEARPDMPRGRLWALEGDFPQQPEDDSSQTQEPVFPRVARRPHSHTRRQYNRPPANLRQAEHQNSRRRGGSHFFRYQRLE